MLKKGFKPPPEMVKKIWDWVLTRYASQVYLNTNNPEIKELSKKDFVSPKYDFITTIPLDLENWYVKEWDYLNVNVLIFAEQDPEYFGLYNYKTNTIEIIFDNNWLDPSTIHQYERIKASIHRNIEHEVAHLGQFLFKNFGLPSKNISNTDYSPEGQHKKTFEEKNYNLRDIEFYPILNDAKIELKRYLQKWPDMKDEIFRWFLGFPPSDKLTWFLPSNMKSAPRMFFEELKQEPKKWQKAVKELYKSVKEASMRIAKRAEKELKQYILSIKPTDSQLQFFITEQGLKYQGFDNPPNLLNMNRDQELNYRLGVMDAFEYALNEIKNLQEKYDFSIVEDDFNYKLERNLISTSDVIIQTDDLYVVNQLKNHPIVRKIVPA